MLVSEAIAELRNLDALDLTDAEALRLLNEANVELCVRARWTQATLDLGPTVAGQDTYDLPANVAEPRDIYVDGTRYENTDQGTIAKLNNGEYRLRAYGLWYTKFDAAGVQSLALYPIPGAAQTLEMLAVVIPEALGTGDTFAAPIDFDRAVIEYVQGVSIGGSEDDVERRGVHWDEFERQVSRLRARRITASTGHTNATMRIRGFTA